MHRLTLSLSLIIFSLTLSCSADDAQPTRPVPQIRHALIISIDGLRPDMLLRSDTPTLHKLLDEGTYTFWARTIPESITLPSHTSMLTGVTAQRHGIEWNTDLPLIHPVYPAVPTLFERLKKAGYTTAMAAGKSKFKTLNKPDTIDWVFVPEQTTITDDVVADHAASILREHHPDLIFVHFPNVDNVGHAAGWGSHEQRKAIELADAAVARVLKTLDDEKLADSTLLIVTADHGGAGRIHGPDDPRCRHIPWIAVGPGVKKDLDLTTYQKLTVNTEDTFATVCYVMGIKVELELDGRAVDEIFEKSELMHAQSR